MFTPPLICQSLSTTSDLCPLQSARVNRASFTPDMKMLHHALMQHFLYPGEDDLA